MQWTNGSAPYAYNAQTQIFDQPTIAANVLDQIVRVNHTKLQQIKVGGKSIPDFVKSVIKDELRVVSALEEVMEALSQQTE